MNKLARQLSFKRRRSSYYDNTAADLSIPSIILTGVVGDITHPLKQRGFIPLYQCRSSTDTSVGGDGNPSSSEAPSSYVMILKISPKLYMKTAIELGYPLLDITESKDAHVARVKFKSLSILKRMKKELHNFDKAWLMQELQVVNRKEGYANNQELLTDVNTFYGSKTALLFAFEFFLQQYLLVPAILGALLFAYQYSIRQLDTQYNPLFMLFLVLWTIVLMRLWYRENSTLCFEWGVADADENRRIREVTQATKRIHSSVEWWRIGLIIAFQLLFFMVTLEVSLYFMPKIERSATDNGYENLFTLQLFVVYSVVVWGCGAIFNKVASFINKEVYHEPRSVKEHHLIFSSFSYHFFNNNFGLLYATFYLQNLQIVSCLLGCMVIVTTMLDYFLHEVYGAQPFDLKRSYQQLLSVEGKSLIGTTSNEDAEEKWKPLILDELKRPEYNPHLQHLRLTTQYSFCCLFVVALPITPLFMWLYKKIEPKLHLQKLKKSARTSVVDCSSLAEWLICFKFINIMSLIVNSFLFCILTSDLSIIVPKQYEPLLDSETNRFLLMIFLEHVVVLVEVLLSYFFEMVPQGVQLKEAMEKLESLNKLVHERLAMYQFIGKNVLEDKAMENSQKKSATDILNNKYTTQYGHNPYLMLGIALTPLLCVNFGISQFVFVPICILYFSYLKSSKDKHDLMAAAGIISDENVLHYIQQEMPSWISSSDVERAMWLDTTLQTLWPNIAKSSQGWLMDYMEPMLKNSNTGIIPSIVVKELNLGAVPPKITGVRNIKTTESMVRLDVEFVWAAVPEIMLEVGKNLNLEVRKVFFSCKLRVELSPLIAMYPTFGAVSLSFMGKPKIDFSFKVGGLDLMSIGIASTDYSIAMLVGDYMRSCLEFMVYPKKHIIPMVDNCDMEKLIKVIPVGILKLTIVSAKDLIVADYMSKSSDPYVIIKFMDNKLKTRTVFKNLNPIWNETFDLMVYDRETQSVVFEVFDYDVSTNLTKGIGAKDDFLGRATLSLDRIQLSKTTEFNMKLYDTKSGSLNVICEYNLLKKNGRPKFSEGEVEGKDIIFQFSPDAFTTDILEEEPTPLYISSDDESFLGDENEDYSDDYNSTNDSHNSRSGKEGSNFAFHKFNPFYGHKSSPETKLAPKHTPPQGRIRKTSIETNEERFRRVSTNHGKSTTQGGVLCVTHMSCRNIEKSTRNMTKSLRPFIEVSVENQVKRTESKPKIRNPIYEETFNFLVADATVGSVTFKVINEFALSKNVPIGQFSVEIRAVQQATGKLEKQFIMDGKTDNQMFLCTLEWVDIAN